MSGWRLNGYDRVDPGVSSGGVAVSWSPVWAAASFSSESDWIYSARPCNLPEPSSARLRATLLLLRDIGESGFLSLTEFRNCTDLFCATWRETERVPCNVVLSELRVNDSFG